MPKLAWIVALIALSAPAWAQTVPDLRGTWKGESQSIVLGGAPHHPAAANQPAEPRLTSVPFTLVIDKQDGRRFAGTFTSTSHSEKVVAVVSHNGSILMADDDGYTIGTLLAANRLELCYMHSSQATRVASCAEVTKQP
jgi:hypothetical protein